jgi:hypothetical protein
MQDQKNDDDKNGCITYNATVGRANTHLNTGRQCRRRPRRPRCRRQRRSFSGTSLRQATVIMKSVAGNTSLSLRLLLNVNSVFLYTNGVVAIAIIITALVMQFH